MLRELIIQNFTIIDQARIPFSHGFNILTGETGAGKSIIIGALSFLLGAKVTSEIVRQGDKKAVVEALFESPPDSPLWHRLQDLGIEPEEDRTLILRREMSGRGKGNCFINNRAVTLSAMNRALNGLVAVHGQHQQQVLLDPSNHIAMLDRFAGLWEARERVKQLHQVLTNHLQEIELLRANEREQAQRQDLILFQSQEITRAKLSENEEGDLVREEKILSSAHKYIELLQRTYSLLYESDHSVLSALSSIQQDLEVASHIDETLQSVLDTFKNVYYQLQENASEIRSKRDDVEIDPQRLEFVVQRLEEIRRLKKKYGKSIAEILIYQQQIEHEHEQTSHSAGQIEAYLKKAATVLQNLQSEAQKLSQKRKIAAPKFKRKMEAELKELGFESVSFEVRFSESSTQDLPLTLPLALKPEGYEQAEFLIAPNAGEALKPVVKIASGGEISRLMLAFRSLVADLDAVQSLIFDEVDVGIGGKSARTVGQKIEKIAKARQVICITHLPQIASMSHHHLKVSKEVIQGRTYSKITLLSKKERISEIARMLDGEAQSELSKDHAAQLLLTHSGEERHSDGDT